MSYDQVGEYSPAKQQEHDRKDEENDGGTLAKKGAGRKLKSATRVRTYLFRARQFADGVGDRPFCWTCTKT